MPDVILPQPIAAIVPPGGASVQAPPLSGRYEGARQSSALVATVLDLRIDIDARDEISVVTNKVSGDFYRQNNPPGQAAPPLPPRVYVESWIVDQPSITWQ